MTEQNKEDSNEGDCPLTRSDWVMFLSGEIHNEESRNNIDTTPTFALLVVVVFSIIGIMLAVITTNLPDANINHILSDLLIFGYIISAIVIVYIAYTLYSLLFLHPKVQENVEKLKNLRENVISGETDSNKIRKKWEELNKIQLKRGGKYGKKN